MVELIAVVIAVITVSCKLYLQQKTRQPSGLWADRRGGFGFCFVLRVACRVLRVLRVLHAVCCVFGGGGEQSRDYRGSTTIAMDTRPGESTRVHVSGSQLAGIRTSLQNHLQRKLDERLAQLNDYDIDDDEMDVQELKSMLVDDIQGGFLNTLMEQLCSACILDENVGNTDTVNEGEGEGDDGDEDDKIEPYDFALNDKLRATYQEFEDVVEETCKSRREVPPQMGEILQRRLASDVILLRGVVAERVAATAGVLAAVGDDEDSKEDEEDNNDNNDNNDTLHQLVAVKKTLGATAETAETVARVARFN